MAAAEQLPETELSLRERKKRETRRTIQNVATRLFLDRGFEAVTVAEVAREANVSVKTVFNYFPTKEDLFWADNTPFEAVLESAIRDRAPGESFLTALWRADKGMLPTAAQIRDEDWTHVPMRDFQRVVEESPALTARLYADMERYEAQLAQLMAEEIGADPEDLEPQLFAAVLISAMRVLFPQAFRRLPTGASNADVERVFGDLIDRSYAMLRTGLATYGCTRPDPARPDEA